MTQETGPQQRQGVKVYRRKVLCGGNQARKYPEARSSVVCLRKLLETTVATAENREDMSPLSTGQAENPLLVLKGLIT